MLIDNPLFPTTAIPAPAPDAPDAPAPTAPAAGSLQLAVERVSLKTHLRAGLAYTTYCNAVGGKAFNGDPLPSWSDFAADPVKQKQVQAWIAATLAVSADTLKDMSAKVDAVIWSEVKPRDAVKLAAPPLADVMPFSAP